MSETLEFDGHGTLLISGYELPAKWLRTSRRRYASSDCFEFELRLPEEGTPEFIDLDLRRGGASFRGRTHSGRSLAVPELRWRRAQSRQLQGQTDEVKLGFEDLPFPVQEQAVVGYLGPSPFSQDSAAWLSNEPPAEKLRWDCGVGEAVLTSIVEHEAARLDEADGVTSIRRAIIRLNLRGEECYSDVSQLAGSFLDSLEAALTVLSLLSRRHADVGLIIVSSRGEKDGRGVLGEGEWHRRARDAGREAFEPMVNPYSPPSQEFGGWVEKLATSDIREALGSATRSLVEGYQARLLENQLLHAFTAMETVVNALDEGEGKATTLSRSPFERLAKKLRAGIRQFGEDEALAGEVVDAICRKVPELRRAPLVPRILSRLRDLGVETHDLWAASADLEKEIGAAYARRSEFFHTGRIGDIRTSYFDWLRIQTLGERLVFRMLGGSPQWMWPQAFEHLRILEPEVT